MPRKMSGIAISVIDASRVASRTPSVVFESAIHLYRSSDCTPFESTGNLNSPPVDPRYSQTMNVATDSALLASELRLIVGRLIRRMRAEGRFPLAQGAVLGRLDRCGAATVSALAAAERVRPQSMSQTVSELEADGLVSRRPDP